VWGSSGSSSSSSSGRGLRQSVRAADAGTLGDMGDSADPPYEYKPFKRLRERDPHRCVGNYVTLSNAVHILLAWTADVPYHRGSCQVLSLGSITVFDVMMTALQLDRVHIIAAHCTTPTVGWMTGCVQALSTLSTAVCNQRGHRFEHNTQDECALFCKFSGCWACLRRHPLRRFRTHATTFSRCVPQSAGVPFSGLALTCSKQHIGTWFPEMPSTDATRQGGGAACRHMHPLHPTSMCSRHALGSLQACVKAPTAAAVHYRYPLLLCKCLPDSSILSFNVLLSWLLYCSNTSGMNPAGKPLREHLTRCCRCVAAVGEAVVLCS
jgi:hypothetical protein